MSRTGHFKSATSGIACLVLTVLIALLGLAGSAHAAPDQAGLSSTTPPATPRIAEHSAAGWSRLSVFSVPVRHAPKVGDDLGAAAPKALGPGTNFGSKIQGQLPNRGWTQRLAQSAIDRPARTVATRDTRHLAGGGRMDDPATAFYGQRGGYVVRNTRSGDIVQVSDRTNPNWKAPWDQ